MILANIKTLCENEGITIAELERKTNIGNGVIARWANGYPNVYNLKKVADHFGVTIDSLMNDAS